LEEFDWVAGGIVEQDLLAGGAGDDLVAKAQAVGPGELSPGSRGNMKL
jgi:hypothetical protein